MNAEQHTGLGNSCFSRPDAKKNRDIVNLGCKGSPYLIFVMNAVNGVPVNILAECKINSRRTRKLLFWVLFISQQ